MDLPEEPKDNSADNVAVGDGAGLGRKRPVKINKGSTLDLAEPNLAATAFPPLEPVDQDEIPNGLLIVTCDTEPAEIAVPLNATDKKFCNSVQARAYRQDDSGSYEVSADYHWVMEEPEIAALAWSANPAGGVRRLTAQYDAFSGPDEWSEPTTELLVCALPREGGPDFFPLCRTLLVRSVINVEGAWCFSGASFETECDSVTILQDGRYLYVDQESVPGRLYERSVEFTRQGFAYEGVMDSEDYIYGIVRLAGTSDIQGTWSAWKMPLF